MNCISRTISIYGLILIAANAEKACLLMYFGLAVESNLCVALASLSISKGKCHPIHPKQSVKKWKRYVAAHRRLIDGHSTLRKKTIGTHNGTFHCDEALAVFLLRQTNAFRDAGKVILYSRNSYSYIPLDLKRSRDPNVLGACDVVVDVGAVYDEAALKFDHHQRGFTEVFGHGFETKLSSAGLIYKWASLHLLMLFLTHLLRHFGKDVIANTIQSSLDDPQVHILWLKLYKVRLVLRLWWPTVFILQKGIHRGHRCKR